MAAIRINWKPSDRQLRQFGLIGLAAFPALGWVFSGSPSPSTWVDEPSMLMIGGSVAGLILGLLAWLRPGSLKLVFIGMTLVAFPIGLVLSELIILLIYITIFVPVALVFRCIGRDGLQRKIDRGATTYWTSKETPKDAESYFRQS